MCDRKAAITLSTSRLLWERLVVVLIVKNVSTPVVHCIIILLCTIILLIILYYTICTTFMCIYVLRDGTSDLRDYLSSFTKQSLSHAFESQQRGYLTKNIQKYQNYWTFYKKFVLEMWGSKWISRFSWNVLKTTISFSPFLKIYYILINISNIIEVKAVFKQ